MFEDTDDQEADRKALDAGLFAIKFLAVVNGGGLLALLHVLTSGQTTEPLCMLPEDIASCFLAGLWLAGVAAIFSYFYRSYLKRIQNPKYFLQAANISGSLSFIAFSVGSGWALYILTFT